MKYGVLLYFLVTEENSSAQLVLSFIGTSTVTTLQKVLLNSSARTTWGIMTIVSNYRITKKIS